MLPHIPPPPPIQSRPANPPHTPVTTLWRQLEPQLQKQLAQHWAKLIQQASQASPPGESSEHEGD